MDDTDIITVDGLRRRYTGGRSGYDAVRDPRRYTFFYEDPRAKQFYKDWTAHVLNRVNPLIGASGLSPVST